MTEPDLPSRPIRWLWLLGGLVCVGIGGVGVVVPGLPTTIFFILAAAAFTRSSPRLYRWVLELPGIGRHVADYRSGLGMPRRAKIAAITCIVVFAGGAELFVLTHPVARILVAVVALAGIAYILRIPTKLTDELSETAAR
ncbi:YbaN family protein [Euzebya tangerina]|uniref:YbaN family protein n=1 Tax=Euzebya tangerina TaxID=591198 RepID=UPI00196A2FCE|nr:YbaN family protein [Euzebya tangerina]